MDKPSPQRNQVIVAFVGDLMLETRITSAASKLGFQIEIISQADHLQGNGSGVLSHEPGEPIFGAEAELVDRLTSIQPGLLVFDLGNDRIPWNRWISFLKSSPATRRIPILCFGPHIDTQSLNRAKDLGAEVVVPRSRFISNLSNLLKDSAQINDRSSIAASCLEPISAEALAGLEEFNKGNYFDSHEHLEDAWNLDDSDAKEVYRGVLQIAVAYLQITRGNYRGAVKMFLRSRQWLAPMPSRCRGIDIEKLKQDAEAVYQELIVLGPENIGEFNLNLLRPVSYKDA